MEGDSVKFHHTTQNGTQFRFIYLLTYLFTYVKTEGEKEEEKQQYVVASCAPPAGDLAHNPGMYPDWELNQWSFGLQAGAQSTEPHQPGQQFKTCELFISGIFCLIFLGCGWLQVTRCAEGETTAKGGTTVSR